jgi:hypothetical protein
LADGTIIDDWFIELEYASSVPLPLAADSFVAFPRGVFPSAPALDEDTITTSSSPNKPSAYRTLPDLEIGLLLIEVYFTRVFTASLLYDHKAFVESYRAGTLPKHILLSTFALASLCVLPRCVDSMVIRETILTDVLDHCL